jgi:membrane fusion protein (multidrug efflux system)
MNTKFTKFFLLLILLSCEKKAVTKSEPTVEVSTMIVRVQTLPWEFEFTGVSQSSHLVNIWSRTEGNLKSINYREGSFVKEGDVLFELDASEFIASVNEAKANLEREKANLASAEKSMNRLKPLLEKKAVSQKDLDDAATQVAVEQALVRSAQAQLDKAELQLSYTKIISPISGYTTDAKSREGTLINPQTNGLMTTVSVIDPIWVSINVSGSFYQIRSKEIESGQLIIPKGYEFDVILILSDGSKFPNHGKVSFISPVFDPNTGTSSVRAIFPNPDKQLRPGQFVNAVVLGAIRPNAMIVPQESVQQSDQGTYVWVVNDKHRAERRLVETGEWYKNSWIIKSGLKDGDRVVVLGVNKIKDGTLLKW